MMRCGRVWILAGALLSLAAAVWSADSEVLRPRVPIDQMESARAVTNPFPVTPEVLQKGKALLKGKRFVVPATERMGKDWEWTWTIPRSRDRSQGILPTRCGSRPERMENCFGF